MLMFRVCCCAGVPWENMLWSLLLATNLDYAHFAPKMSLRSPARCSINLRVNCHWKESCGSRNADSHFRKISNSPRLFLCILLLLLQLR